MKYVIMVLLAAVALQANGEESAYAETVTTPHWDWEGRHTGGTVRALFLVNEHARRQVDELAQRFDLCAETEAVGVRALAAMECDRERWAALATQRWDVVVLASSTAWPALGITNQDLLVESMKEGRHVVVYNPQQGTNDNLTALTQGRALTNHAASVFRGLPADWVTFRTPFQMKEYEVGKGRLFLLDRIDTHWTRFNAFMGQGMDGTHALSYYDQPVTPELFYAMVGRWLRLAAGREGTGGRMTAGLASPDAPVALGAEAPFRFRAGGGAAAGDQVAWVLVSPFGDALASGTNALAAADGVDARVTLSQAGRLLLRWQWKRGPVTLDWGACGIVVSNPLAFATAAEPEPLDPEKPLSPVWTLTAGAPDSARVTAQIYDSDGRLVAQQEAAAESGRMQVPGWIPRTPGHELRLVLHDGNAVFDERRLALFFRQDRASDLQPYHVIVWGTEQGEYSDLFRFERLRQLGITAIATIGARTNLNRMAAARGLRVVPTNILIPPGARKKAFNKEAEARRLESFAAGMAPLTPLGYSLADEPGGVDPAAFRNFGAEAIHRRDPGARVGFCGIWEGYNRDVPAFFKACDFAEPYSPFHLYTANLWMGCERDLYRSFKRPDSIVTCWTHYAPWLDSEPYSRTPPWLWLFEGLNGVSYFDSAGEFSVLPGDMRTTHETRWWSEEVREIRNGIGEQIIAATRDAGAVRVLYQPNAAGAAAWARAFNETRTPFRFISHAELEGGVEPGVRLLVCPNVPVLADRELDQVRRFVEAGGTLVATAPFGRYRPMLPKPVEAPKPAKGADLDNLLDALDKPAPAEKEPDPIDPWIREISKAPNPIPGAAEADRLAALCGVRYGGATGAVPMASLVVVRRPPEADGVPVEATWTESGAGFATLTGATLRAAGFQAAGSGRVVAVMRETDAATNSTPVEIAEARATPGVIANACGKGRSWFLAMQPDVASLRAWLPALLAGAGVPEPEPAVTLKAGSNDTVYVFRFTDGPIRLVGVVQDYWKTGPAMAVEGGPETALYFNHGPSLFGESPAVLALREKTHIYDVRRGLYLGALDSYPFSLQPGRPDLFALLPYRVSGVGLIAPELVRPGDVLELAVRLEGDAKEWGNHVVHVEVADPEGRVVEADRYNLHTRGGKGALRIPLAWNALPGDWTVTARDSISGVSARSVLRVESAKPAFRVWRKEPVAVERVPVAWPEGNLKR